MAVDKAASTTASHSGISSDAKSFINKKEKMNEEVEKLSREGRIVAAEANIESRKDKLEEATDHYEEALADDPGAVSIPLEGPEVVRTRALMEQAEQELEEAKINLKNLQENKEPAVDNSPLKRDF